MIETMDKRMQAYKAVADARSRGELNAPDACEKCGAKRPVEGHHHNGYEPQHWLDLKWLCRKCHVKADAQSHKSRGAGELVNLGLKIKRETWLALHERANHRRTNVTQLIIYWLNEERRRDRLPPIG